MTVRLDKDKPKSRWQRFYEFFAGEDNDSFAVLVIVVCVMIVCLLICQYCGLDETLTPSQFQKVQLKKMDDLQQEVQQLREAVKKLEK
jgi:Na+/melibiose symporter-like transporter